MQMLFSGELSSALNFRDRILRLSEVSSLPGLSQFMQKAQMIQMIGQKKTERTHVERKAQLNRFKTVAKSAQTL